MNRTLHRLFLSLYIFLFPFAHTIIAQPVLNFQTVATGLNSPVDIVSAPGDGRLYVVQQGGLIRIWNGSNFIDFINLASVITPADSEQGLLSIAFHPSYSGNRYFFVWYTDVAGAVTLARYQRNISNPDIADPGSGTVLLSIPKPGTPYFRNHNGAKLIFGSDGMLYIGTGDGGSGGDPLNNAQNGNSLLGKMLRIDVNGFASAAPFYTIPPGNPYAADGDGILNEIYAIGLRNPWRWSFDRANGDMWIADVGQNAWEEVNWLPAGTTAGVNYGWRCYEGAHLYPGGCTPTDTVSPIFEYPHNNTTGGFSITGGYVYRGPDQQNAPLLGYYITADFVSGNVWLLKPNGSGGWTSNMQTGLPGNISSFGEGQDGTLYALGRSTGAIYKVMVSAVIPVTISSFAATHKTDHNLLQWNTSSELNVANYYIEYGTTPNTFSRVGRVSATGNQLGSRYSFQHVITQVSDAYYRLAIEDADRSVRYSQTIRLKAQTMGISVYPTVLPRNSPVHILSENPLKEVQLLNNVGSLVWRKNMAGISGTLSVLPPSLPPGIYILWLSGDDFSHKQKIILY